MARPASRLTHRDYKRANRKSSLDVSRFRDLGLGLLAGVLATSALFLYRAGSAKPVESDTPQPHPKERSAPAADTTEQTSAPEGERYDFYEMLPNFEVVVPEKDREVKRDARAAKVERPGVYVLQAGSYRNVGDAERVASQLKLQG